MRATDTITRSVADHIGYDMASGAQSSEFMVLLDDKIVHEFNHEDLLQSYELRDVNGYVSVRMAGESAAFKYYIQVW